jgi:hypothetical protein
MSRKEKRAEKSFRHGPGFAPRLLLLGLQVVGCGGAATQEADVVSNDSGDDGLGVIGWGDAMWPDATLDDGGDAEPASEASTDSGGGSDATAPADASCDGPVNGCGGCSILAHPPSTTPQCNNAAQAGTPTGCGRGHYLCTGTDTTTCTGDVGNGCGGCLPLSHPYKSSCSSCGGEYLCSSSTHDDTLCSQPCSSSSGTSSGGCNSKQGTSCVVGPCYGQIQCDGICGGVVVCGTNRCCPTGDHCGSAGQCCSSGDTSAGCL